MENEPLPETLRLDEALRAAVSMTGQYVALEREPDEGLVLYQQYLCLRPGPFDVAIRRLDWDRYVSDVYGVTCQEFSELQEVVPGPGRCLRW
jgi:hypothetical protein